jgi:glycosyltransferase involved in cell wall biosynthesis
MKIIFVTTYDARDIRNWSGIPFYLAKGFLEADIEVEFIDNLEFLPTKYFKFRLRHLFYNRLLKKRLGKYISFYEPKNLKFIASQVSQKINKIEGGIVFSPGTIPIAYLNTNKPIFFWTDATFAVMENYYEDFKGLSKKTIKDCHLYERNAIERSSLAIYSSEWAANSSIRDYSADSAKVKVIPFGSNIEIKRTVTDIVENNNNKSKTICKLLFIGQNWERKGGETAVNVVKYLNENYIKTELTIVGCKPPESERLPDFIHLRGFIDKSSKEGEKLINRLYSENHFFILPTIAECTPVVFSEANSFGLPIITTTTGGISSIISNDINGRMFGNKIDIPECARYIAEIFNDYNRYKNYSLTSFNECLTRLNWQVSISKCISYLQNLEKSNRKKQPENAVVM